MDKDIGQHRRLIFNPRHLHSSFNNAFETELEREEISYVPQVLVSDSIFST